MAEAIIDVVIGARTDQFGSAMQKAMGTLRRFIAIGSMTSFVRSTAAAADDMVDLAKRTGASLQTLQEFAFAAKQSGSSLQEFTSALKFLARAQVDALAGNDGAVAAFQRFGVSLADLRKMEADELLKAIARAVQSMGATSQVTADMLEVMGRGADTLLPAFRDGLDQLAQQAHEAGTVIRDDLLVELANMNDELDRTWSSFKADTTGLVATVLRGLDYLVTSLKSTFIDLKWLAAGATGNRPWSDETWREDDRLWRSFSARHGFMMFEDEGVSMGADPRVTRMLQRRKEKNRLWASIGDPGEIKSWEASTISDEQAARHSTLPAADALARIGGMRGGLDPARRIQETQLGVLRSMDQKLGRIHFDLNAD